MEKRLRFGFLDVSCCPYCNSVSIKKDGIRNHRQRYRCKNCKKTFYPTTGTIFASTKKNEIKWRDFVIQMTNDLTLSASHELSGVSTNTAMLWRRKYFVCIMELNESAVLYDVIWFDEIYCNISEKGRIYKPDGHKLKGISRNKIAILLAVDIHGNHYARVIGKGKPTSKQIDDAVGNHFAEGSLMIHDGFHGHQQMLDRIHPKGVVTCKTKEQSSIGKMQPINQFCASTRRILYLYVGERPDHLQEYVSYACLKHKLKSIPVKERRKEVIRLCAATKKTLKRNRRK